MKRTAATMIMLAGLGGGCASLDTAEGAKPFGQASVGREVPGVMGPNGEPIHVAAGGDRREGDGHLKWRLRHP